MSESNQKSEARWQACPEGLLSRTVSGFGHKRRKQEAAQTAIAAVGFIALLVIGGLVARQFLPASGPNFGDITCSDTQSLMQDYASGKLDAETVARVEQHLATCDHCRMMFDQMKATASAGDPRQAGTSHHACRLVSPMRVIQHMAAL